MAKTRQKRPGPKSSKPVEDEKNEESTEEPDAAETKKRTRAAKEQSKAPEKTPAEPSDPLEEAVEQRKEPSVSSQVDGETPMDSDEPETNGSGKGDPKDSNEGDEALADVPQIGSDESRTNKLADATLEEVVEDVEEPAEKPLVLRLVPLTQLLKPEVLDKPADKSKPVRKSSVRARKSTSFIEISSSSSEEPEIISSDSASSDDEFASKSKRKRNGESSKENNSTNAKLSKGSSKKGRFKEPEMPSKGMQQAKELSINLSKMPERVNKLMKSYRVENETQIESWSETDDFENMISTSKIDRVALKTNKHEAPAELEKSRRVEKTKEKSEGESSEVELPSDDEEVVQEKSKPRVSKKRKKLSNDEETEAERVANTRKRPERSSARAAKLRTKSVIEISEISSSDEDEVPLKSRKQLSKPSCSSKPTGKFSKTTGSESDNQPITKKANIEKELSSDSSSSGKLFKKKKKKPPEDDHSKEKTSRRARKRSSSEEDEGEKKLPVRGSKAKQTKESQRPRKKKETAPETRSSSRKGGKKDERNVSVKLNKQKLKTYDSDESDAPDSDKDSEKSSSNSKESSLSEDERVLKPIKLGKEIPNQRSSTSESEAESSNGAVLADVIAKLEKDATDSEAEAEIPPKELLPILDEKLRKRNKFEANTAFNVLKQKIKQRKTKRKVSTDETPNTERSSRRNQTNGSTSADKEYSEKNNNDEASERSDPEDSSSIVNNFHLNSFGILIEPLHRVKATVKVVRPLTLFFSSCLFRNRLELRSCQPNEIDLYRAVKKRKETSKC